MQKNTSMPLFLKIPEKVAFNIASEASYVYILSGQKFIKNVKKGQFGEILKNWSLWSDRLIAIGHKLVEMAWHVVCIIYCNRKLNNQLKLVQQQWLNRPWFFAWYTEHFWCLNHWFEEKAIMVVVGPENGTKEANLLSHWIPKDFPLALFFAPLPPICYSRK